MTRRGSDDICERSVAGPARAVDPGNLAMSGPRGPRSFKDRPTRSLCIALGVVGLVAVVLGRWAPATSQTPEHAVDRTGRAVELSMATLAPPRATSTTRQPTAATSTRPAVPARPSPGCAEPTGPMAPGTSDVPILSRGERRSYLRTIPMGDGSTPAPLVLVLDDGSGDPGAFVDGARWSAIAPLHHLIVAAPRWSRADDDQLAADTIMDIELDACVDLARVSVAGFSTGATLGARVVCDHPGLVTALVAVAGLAPPDRCGPEARVPVLAIQGVLDEVTSAASVVDATEAWARLDHCRSAPVSETVGWNVEYHEFRGCEAAVGVQLYLLVDAGHEWPERVEDPSAATRWTDLMSTTTIAVAFCEAFAR